MFVQLRCFVFLIQVPTRSSSIGRRRQGSQDWPRSDGGKKSYTRSKNLVQALGVAALMGRFRPRGHGRYSVGTREVGCARRRDINIILYFQLPVLALTVDTISNGFALVTMVDIHRHKLAKIVLEGMVRRGLLGVSRQVFLWAVELWKSRS